MGTHHQPIAAGTRLRRALGKIRRSAPVTRTTGFFALQARRARQRLSSRFVRGVWLDTGKYVASAPRGVFGIYHRDIEPAGETTIASPTFAPRPPPLIPGGSIHLSWRSRGLAILQRPWVVGSTGAVIGTDRRLLWDLSYQWPGQPHRHTSYDLGDLAAVDLSGSTATLAAMGADENYFHFLLNSVARLAYLRRAAHQFAAPDRYLLSGRVTPFVAETLALFGIPRERIVGTADYPAVRPDHLIAPPLVYHPFVVPLHICEFLRSEILAALPPRRRKLRRIFIDRSDAAARRIQNLDALRPLLEDFDIEVMRLSGRSVLEQAALFNEAELIIANHGAALANLVFCEPGTRVFQILAPGMMEREYRTISQHGRLRHDYIVAEFASLDDLHLPRKQRDLILSSKILHDVLETESRISLPT